MTDRLLSLKLQFISLLINGFWHISIILSFQVGVGHTFNSMTVHFWAQYYSIEEGYWNLPWRDYVRMSVNSWHFVHSLNIKHIHFGWKNNCSSVVWSVGRRYRMKPWNMSTDLYSSLICLSTSFWEQIRNYFFLGEGEVTLYVILNTIKYGIPTPVSFNLTNSLHRLQNPSNGNSFHSSFQRYNKVTVIYSSRCCLCPIVLHFARLGRAKTGIHGSDLRITILILSKEMMSCSVYLWDLRHQH
jgi:hypothetical protein